MRRHHPNAQDLVVGIPVVIAVGFIVAGGVTEGWHAMGPSLFTEGSGVLLSVSLIAWLVQYLERKRRRARWELVRNHTLREIQAHLLEASQMLLNDPVTAGGPPPVFGHIDKPALTEDNLGRELEKMKKMATDLTVVEAEALDLSLTATLNGIAYHLRPIIDACLPRVLALDDDVELIGSLIDLEFRTSFIRRWPEDTPKALEQIAMAGLPPVMRLGPEQTKIYLVDYLDTAARLSLHIDRLMPDSEWLIPWAERVKAAFPVPQEHSATF